MNNVVILLVSLAVVVVTLGVMWRLGKWPFAIPAPTLNKKHNSDPNPAEKKPKGYQIHSYTGPSLSTLKEKLNTLINELSTRSNYSSLPGKSAGKMSNICFAYRQVVDAAEKIDPEYITCTTKSKKSAYYDPSQRVEPGCFLFYELGVRMRYAKQLFSESITSTYAKNSYVTYWHTLISTDVDQINNYVNYLLSQDSP